MEHFEEGKKYSFHGNTIFYNIKILKEDEKWGNLYLHDEIYYERGNGKIRITRNKRLADGLDGVTQAVELINYTPLFFTIFNYENPMIIEE